MALTNPAYARRPMLGGFSPAGADATSYGGRPIEVPRDVGAEAAGSELGNRTYSTDPVGTTQDAFSASLSGSTPGGEGAIPPIPPSEALPSPLSSNDITKIFAPLYAEIEGQTKPPGQPLPPPTPALATFLSVLAGSLGAHLTRDPRVQESVIRTLEDHEHRRQAIEDQNYANDLLFNRQKAMQRLTATGQRLAAEIEAKSSTGEEASKPLEPKDYISQRTELLKAKDLPKETEGGIPKLGWFGKDVSKERQTAQLDKEALHSGNSQTIAAAKRNIQQSVLKKLGLQMKTKFSRAESVAIRDELRKTYDIEPAEVDF